MSKSNLPKRIEVHPFLAAMKGPDGRIIVHLTTDGVAEPAAVGILLVDVARHYARMFKATGRVTSEAAALAEIRKLFEAEWDSPTDLGEGGIPN